MDIYGHLMRVVHKVREGRRNTEKKMGRGVVADEYLLDSGGPEHDANDTEEKVEIVLGLAGTELIFFPAVHEVLCLGSVTKTALTADCFECCQMGLAQGQGFLCSSGCYLTLPWARGWQGTQLGQ